MTVASRGRRGPTVANERGMTLLEVLVALVLLSVVVVGYLQLFHGSHQLLASSREWSHAVAYAADAMEQAKRDPAAAERGLPTEELAGGYRRQITSRPWRPGLALVTATVVLPDGARFDLRTLVPVDSSPRPQRAPAPTPGVQW